MFGVFIEDAQTQSAALSEGLLRLERSPGDMPAADSLMRASHSLKGAARVVGLEWLVNLAHKMEDCFSAAREGRVKADSAFFDLLFDCADFIASAVAARFEGADESAAARLAPTFRRCSPVRTSPSKRGRLRRRIPGPRRRPPARP